ncbi:relaxase/mobilization nuclease domain-containing protein [Gaoshiqia sediminis]|uniref:Relaxase/mobilization nuclease domain-containing protein n=1 Tax=Gaoshiqia sediminis TaxID=2986998 RepID=A0AA42C6E6_9BACT|nr:relaxase/mobilization nuclease domain-containing protein [Gaoshiqia sediminis]MCW0483828.1 relaxase/mobilization nuclease domain-containing protein [Gaoshiqia sediminis]
MMAKIVKGQGFRGVVNYVLDQSKGAEILDSQGVRLKNAGSIIDSFVFQSEMNARIKKPVGHISLDFSAQDLGKLNNSLMVKISQEYMNLMGISNTQYILCRHFDKEHPHVHLVFNRVDNDGKTISDRNDRYRSGKICKELTQKHGLYFARGKEKVKAYRLREPDKTKYEIYESLKAILPTCHNWDQIIAGLKEQGIGVTFKFKGKTNEIQGVVFDKNGYSFNGSKVDRQFSFSKITFQLKRNISEQVYQKTKVCYHIPDHLVAGNILKSLFHQMGKHPAENENRTKQDAVPKLKRKRGIRR